MIVDKLCRSCMCESTNAKNLFETKNAFGDQTHIVADMFMACASVEVESNRPISAYLHIFLDYFVDNKRRPSSKNYMYTM